MSNQNKNTSNNVFYATDVELNNSFHLTEVNIKGESKWVNLFTRFTKHKNGRITYDLGYYSANSCYKSHFFNILSEASIENNGNKLSDKGVKIAKTLFEDPSAKLFLMKENYTNLSKSFILFNLPISLLEFSDQIVPLFSDKFEDIVDIIPDYLIQKKEE